MHTKQEPVGSLNSLHICLCLFCNQTRRIIYLSD